MSNFMSEFLLYFGCWDGAGHFLYDNRRQSIYTPPCNAFPPEALDTSRVFLPYPEKVGHGQLTHVVRGTECVTVLAWWDRTFDQRGKCNAAIQCSGWRSADDLWKRFTLVYTGLAPKLQRPLLPALSHYP